ncbi:MAG: hypothetical protein ACQETO_04095 [Pseudomonadota bacterium]
MNTLRPLLSLLILLSVPALAGASAKEERHYEYDVSDIEALHIDASVGTIRIEPASGSTVTVDLVIEADSTASWIPFLGRDRDVSGMELTHRVRGRELRLHFDENHVTTDWVVRVPVLQTLRVDLGVGNIEGDLPRMPADIELGVGSVELSAAGAAVGRIDLDAGVGDTRIRGASGKDARSALVGSQSSGWGDGEHRIRIDVGVGDVSLSLRDSG